MLLDNIIPHPALSEWIRLYRIADFVFSDPKFISLKAYPPRPQECLNFYPRNVERVHYEDGHKIIPPKRAIVTGQHTVVNYRLTGNDFLVFMVVFQPGALYRLTGIPAAELMNRYLAAEDILGKEVRLVNEQLFNEKSYEEMVTIVERYLQGLIHRAKRNRHVVDRISQLMISDMDDHSLDHFFREACLCQRQFDRMFKERMGITPQLYSRIIKFDRAFRLKNKYPDKDWFTIAIHSGYYDYQHLVKAYKDFTGFSPTEFYKLEKKSPERFFGDKEI